MAVFLGYDSISGVCFAPIIKSKASLHGYYIWFDSTQLQRVRDPEQMQQSECWKLPWGDQMSN